MAACPLEGLVRMSKLSPQQKNPLALKLLDEITALAVKHRKELQSKMDERIAEMKEDDISHFLIYRVLGVATQEGILIDEYQNKGRFLYRHAGSFLETAAKMCFADRNPSAASCRIPNTIGQRPKTFEIDCLDGNLAHEIKWRDATTDGDHITKEHTRMKVIADAGFTPIRVMFYYPNRAQAIRIQEALETLYKGSGGRYYYGDAAWEYVHDHTQIDLKQILEHIAGHLK